MFLKFEVRSKSAMAVLGPNRFGCVLGSRPSGLCPVPKQFSFREARRSRTQILGNLLCVFHGCI